MSVNPKQILQKIISTGGQCDFGTPSICRACPLSKLKPKEDGTFLGCLEAIGVVGLKGKEVDDKYLEAANRKLLDLEMEEALDDN